MMKDESDIVKQLRFEEEQDLNESISVLLSEKTIPNDSFSFTDILNDKNIPISFKQLLDNTNIVVQIVSPEGTFLYVNKKWREVLGYSENDLSHLFVWDIIRKDHHGQCQNLFSTLMSERDFVCVETVFLKKSKEPVFLKGSINVVKENGKIVCIVGFFQDVTRENQLYEEYKVLFNEYSDALIIFDVETGEILDVNKKMCELYGYSYDEAIVLSFDDLNARISSYTQQKTETVEKKAFGNAVKRYTWQGTNLEFAIDKTIELIGLHKEGFEFPVELSLSSVEIDNQCHAIAIIRDISKQKKEESKLQIFSEAVKQNSASILITDSKGAIEYVNPKFESVTGYLLDEVREKNPRVLKSGEQSSEFYQELWDTISQGETWHGEFCNIKKNKELYWEEAWISPILDSNGHITHYIAIKEDITDKKQMLRELHVKKNAIMSSINGMMLIDFDGNIVFVNQAFLKMWEIESDTEILGKPAVMFWKRPGNFLDIIDKAVQDEGCVGELEVLSPSNKHLIVQISVNLVMNEKNKPCFIMTSFVDVTLQKNLQKDFQRFKMISDRAGYGTLIHDKNGVIQYVNNAFASLHGYNSSELIGNNVTMFFSTSEQQDSTEIHKAVENDEGCKGRKVVHTHKNGSKIPLLMSSTFIEASDHSSSFYAKIFVDISDLKEAEQQVHQQFEEVEMVPTKIHDARGQLEEPNQDLEKRVQKHGGRIGSDSEGMGRGSKGYFTLKKSKEDR